ncbi:unnamed protein product, partial [marine sediment metagenome]
MDVIAILVLVATIIFFGVFGEFFFRKTKIPDVLWLIAVGVVAGPILGIVNLEWLWAIVPYFSAIALIVVLFEG